MPNVPQVVLPKWVTTIQKREAKSIRSEQIDRRTSRQNQNEQTNRPNSKCELLKRGWQSTRWQQHVECYANRSASQEVQPR